jgi:hypothetical protein
MFGQTFYHGHLRKYVTLFGTLFNDVYYNRFDSSGDHVGTIKVPISYSPKEKMLARLEADPNLDRPFAIVLPRMGFEMTSLMYDPLRKLSSVKKGFIKSDNYDGQERLKYIYNPVPYNMNFSLYVMVKNTEDGTRILEQILPYFTPDWTATINLIPEMDIKLDIPTVLLNVQSDDIYDGNFTERRSLVWTLDFVMKGYIFGPVKKSEPISLANINFYSANSSVATDVEEKVEVVPGLLANGSPTTNASLSISRTTIPANSNYGYIITNESIDEQ